MPGVGLEMRLILSGNYLLVSFPDHTLQKEAFTKLTLRVLYKRQVHGLAAWQEVVVKCHLSGMT